MGEGSGKLVCFCVYECMYSWSGNDPRALRLLLLTDRDLDPHPHRGSFSVGQKDNQKKTNVTCRLCLLLCLSRILKERTVTYGNGFWRRGFVNSAFRAKMVFLWKRPSLEISSALEPHSHSRSQKLWHTLKKKQNGAKNDECTCSKIVWPPPSLVPIFFGSNLVHPLRPLEVWSPAPYSVSWPVQSSHPICSCDICPVIMWLYCATNLLLC